MIQAAKLPRKRKWVNMILWETFTSWAVNTKETTIVESFGLARADVRLSAMVVETKLNYNTLCVKWTCLQDN